MFLIRCHSLRSADIKRISAVRTVDQAREHVGLAGGVRAADGLADLLHGVEGALIYDGLVSVLDDLPLAGVAVDLGALIGLMSVRWFTVWPRYSGRESIFATVRGAQS